jgi:hypothetical protein
MKKSKVSVKDEPVCSAGYTSQEKRAGEKLEKRRPVWTLGRRLHRINSRKHAETGS